MPKASVKRLIECNKEQLIDLVLDIESYPKFIPYCLGAKIHEKKEENISISITGITGPNGGTKLKPIGLVYIGVKKGNKIIAKKNLFKNKNRISIQKITVSTALNIINNII